MTLTNGLTLTYAQMMEAYDEITKRRTIKSQTPLEVRRSDEPLSREQIEKNIRTLTQVINGFSRMGVVEVDIAAKQKELQKYKEALSKLPPI